MTGINTDRNSLTTYPLSGAVKRYDRMYVNGKIENVNTTKMRMKGP